MGRRKEGCVEGGGRRDGGKEDSTYWSSRIR